MKDNNDDIEARQEFIRSNEERLKEHKLGDQEKIVPHNHHEIVVDACEEKDLDPELNRSIYREHNDIHTQNRDHLE